MKAMKKLTAIVCAICISMIGAQAIAASGPNGSKQIRSHKELKTGTANQTGSNKRIRTSRPAPAAD